MKFLFLISVVALWATFTVAFPIPLAFPFRLGGLGKGGSSSGSKSGGLFGGLFGGGKKGGSSGSPPKESPVKASPAPQSPAPAKTVPAASPASKSSKSSKSSSISASKTAATHVTTPAATTPVPTTSSSINRQAWPTIPIAGARPPTFAEASKNPPKINRVVSSPNPPQEFDVTDDDFVPTELEKRAKKKGKPTDPDLCPKTVADFDPHMGDCAPNECAFYSRVNGEEGVWQKANPQYSLLKNKLDPNFITTNKNSRCDNFWELASEAFSIRANGVVPVLLPPLDNAARSDPNQVTSWPLKDNGGQTIWELIEWPALQRNTAVKQVWRVDMNNSPPLEILVRP